MQLTREAKNVASYPQGRFVQEFARRTLANLRDVRHERVIEWQDTALVSFLLAVFVLPHERVDEGKFMAKLLVDYPEGLGTVVEIKRMRKSKGNVQDDEALPMHLDQLPRYLRNAISHFNIRPESEDGQELTHLLVWNQVPNDTKRYGDDAGKINFVARVHIERLRLLADHVLERLSKSGIGDRYEAIDPIAKFDQQHEPTPSS
jgi:HEPN pEK499 p136